MSDGRVTDEEVPGSYTGSDRKRTPNLGSVSDTLREFFYRHVTAVVHTIYAAGHDTTFT